MSILQWAEERTKRFSVWDIGVLKTYCAVFGAVIGAYFADFVKLHLWWFVAAFVAMGVWLMARMFRPL